MTRRSSLLRVLAASALAVSTLFFGGSVSAQVAEPLSWAGGFGDISNYFDMGSPVEAPHMGDDGNVIVQRSTRGTAYYLVTQNQASFLDADGFHRHARTVDNRFVNWTGDNPVAPEGEWVSESWPKQSVRDYLYETYPDYAPVIDCLAEQESVWSPTYIGQRPMWIDGEEIRAKGILQYIPTTWAGTPEGRRGESVYNPYAQISATVRLLQQGHGSWWETWPTCRHLL